RRQADEEKTALQDEAGAWREQHEATVRQVEQLTRERDGLAEEVRQARLDLEARVAEHARAVGGFRQTEEELARLREQVQARLGVRAGARQGEAGGAGGAGAGAPEARQEELAAARREVDRLRAVTTELEERAGQVAEVDAELRAARAENERLRAVVAEVEER